MEIEFSAQALAMIRYCFCADPQVLGDLFRGLARSDELDHLSLSTSQLSKDVVAYVHI
jgi:hypothetical protein